MNYKRVNNDVNGNPRYVFHFMDLLTDGTRKDLDKLIESGEIMECQWVGIAYRLTLLNMRKLGGKRYYSRDFGGGIVFQSYNIDGLIAEIKSLIG